MELGRDSNWLLAKYNCSNEVRFPMDSGSSTNRLSSRKKKKKKNFKVLYGFIILMQLKQLI
jgi:hypothetical protein